VTAARVRSGTAGLVARLREIDLPLSVYPSAEIMVRPDLDDACGRGELMTIADREAYVLIEFPAGQFFDLRDMVRRLLKIGVRPILAHPERHAELLHGSGAIEALIRAGCLVQVSADSITASSHVRDSRAIKHWIQRGIVHFIGSDGHSPRHRAPRMSAAYRQIASWAGTIVADRVCSLHGLAILEGRPLRFAPPPMPKKRWFSLFR
jgi:protein-tyrosine phosphatase